METKSKYECKHDKDKPRLDLVPPGIIEAVGVVRTYGNKKYGDPDGWKRVEPDRYVAALMRHLCEYLRDRNSIDAESGLPHLWHIACNVAFLIEFQENKGGVKHMAKRQLSKAEKEFKLLDNVDIERAIKYFEIQRRTYIGGQGFMTYNRYSLAIHALKRQISKEAMNGICVVCKHEVNINDNYCSNCGQKL